MLFEKRGVVVLGILVVVIAVLAGGCSFLPKSSSSSSGLPAETSLAAGKYYILSVSFADKDTHIMHLVPNIDTPPIFQGFNEEAWAQWRNSIRSHFISKDCFGGWEQTPKVNTILEVRVRENSRLCLLVPS